MAFASIETITSERAAHLEDDDDDAGDVEELEAKYPPLGNWGGCFDPELVAQSTAEAGEKRLKRFFHARVSRRGRRDGVRRLGGGGGRRGM